MRIVTGLLIVAAAMLIAIGGLVLVQHLFSNERRRQHNDVAGFIYAVLGVSYAVLLGLMLIAVWEQWEAADATTTEEANEVAEIFWLAHRLPQPEGRHIQQLARSYAQVVVEDEWPLMEQGRASQKAWDTLDRMRGTIEGVDPTTGAQLARYTEVLEQLHGLGDARRERLLDAGEGLPPIHVGGANTRRRHHSRVHLPLRLGEHFGAHAHGGGLGDDHLLNPFHRRCPRLPIQGRHTYPPGRRRAGARELSREQVQRPLRVKSLGCLAERRRLLWHQALGPSDTSSIVCRF